MSKIFKLCLISALFLSTASIAWAGFNYDSVNNHYLIDSILRIGGKYVVIGDAEPAPATGDETMATDSGTTDAFLIISGNLVFLNQGPFTDKNSRQLGINEANKVFLTTNKISIESLNTRVLINTTAKPLIFQATTIEMNNDFRITNNQGLTFLGTDVQPINTIIPNTIFVERVLTKELRPLTQQNLRVPDRTQITLGETVSSTSASADYITLGDKPFCQVVEWAYTTDLENLAGADIKSRSGTWTGASGDIPNNTPCTDNGGPVVPTSAGELKYTTKTCCPKNYFVFDLDLQATAEKAKMVCCRAAEGRFPQNN